jgi:hypothetical protein
MAKRAVIFAVFRRQTKGLVWWKQERAIAEEYMKILYVYLYRKLFL